MDKFESSPSLLNAHLDSSAPKQNFGVPIQVQDPTTGMMIMTFA
jgi:hypothetical protein